MSCSQVGHRVASETAHPHPAQWRRSRLSALSTSSVSCAWCAVMQEDRVAQRTLQYLVHVLCAYICVTWQACSTFIAVLCIFQSPTE